ncbi:family 78 glycoside hydrolase catalytic domain, partial [Steroidobacter sp.]|uniref:family 78 glycoside hydrolase catalytic domain n=1 Tax=Steroidobacter sp. TaxID=1978227 RepID=UPI001A62884B
MKQALRFVSGTRSGLTLVRIVLAAISLAMCGPAVASASTPHSLKTESASELLGTDVQRPRLSWLLPSGFVGAQSAYQIRVATSREQLAKPLWDSGKVKSASIHHIEYAGPVTQSRQRYYWQVQSWDSEGRATGWSEPSFWEMGLLAPSDWQAQWIGGRPTVDHDWRDAKLTYEFTLLGSTVDFLFRARPVGKTYGEAYAWKLAIEGEQPVLIPQVRRYTGQYPRLVETTVLKKVPLSIKAEQLRGKPNRLTIEYTGDTITTSLNDTKVDTLTDTAQNSGTIGVSAGGTQAAVLHAVTVEAGDASFQTKFERNDNPFTGGSVRPDGLLVAAGVPNKDIVLPIGAPAPLLRKEFSVAANVKSARIYVAAGGFPKLSLNGEPLNSAIADGVTAYDKRVLYRTLDVTKSLRQGANAIGVELGRGWYALTEPNEWYWHAAPWRSAPTVKLQLEVTFNDGRKQIVVTDNTWSTVDGPTLHDSIYSGERYDARRLPKGWSTAGFDASKWPAANVVAGPTGVLDAAEHQPIATVDTVKPVAVKQVQPGVHVFDFGRIFAGRLKLRVSGAAGQTVSLIQTEKLNKDGTVQIASGLVDTQLQTDRYTLAGSGEEEWTPSFGYKGFRYVQVEGFPGTPTLETLTGEVQHSAVASTGSFESSNRLVNAIHASARNTILNNLHGMQTDTPTYEKNGWTGDAHASSLAAAVNFDIANVWTKWLADYRDAQSPKGEIPEIVPSTPLYGYEGTPGWNIVRGPIPSWDAATSVLPWDLYGQTADLRLLAQMYDTQKKLVDYTGTFFTPDTHIYANPNNPLLAEYALPMPEGPFVMPAWARPDFVPPPPGPSDNDSVASAYYYLMLDLLAQSAELLDKKDDVAKYRSLAEGVKAAYNQRYYDSAKKLYRTPAADGKSAYLQYQNVLPVVFGISPPEDRTAIVRNLNDNLISNDYHLSSTGVFSGRYLPLLLTDFGYSDTVYKLVT